MLIPGFSSDIVALQPIGEFPCATCKGPRVFHLVLHYEYLHFSHVLRWVTRQNYLRACEICGKGEAVPREEAERELGRRPFTVFEQYGCLIWFGILAVVALAAGIGGKILRGEL